MIPTDAPLPQPTVRRVTDWIMCRPEQLTDTERKCLDDLCERSPALATTTECVRRLAQLVRERRNEHLAFDVWLANVRLDGQRELRTLAADMRRNRAAVLAALTTTHTSGAVEGNVTRIILWNQNCQACCALPWRTSRIGRRVAPAGTSSCRGVGPAGVGVSASLSRRRSSALWPSVRAACSSSVSGIETAIFCKLPLAARSWALVESLGGV
nr:transposase [Streptomyces sp. SID12488]